MRNGPQAEASELINAACTRQSLSSSVLEVSTLLLL